MTNKKYQVYLDSDGVLADFDAGILSENPSLRTKQAFQDVLISSYFQEFLGLGHDEIKSRLAGHQTDPKRKEFKRNFNEIQNIKYSIAGEANFFLNLPVMPGAHDLFRGTHALTGNLPHILTAPIDGDVMRCAREKEQWAFNNFSGLFNMFICEKNKHTYATPTSILIDDRRKYTNKFAEAGGIVILYKSAEQALEELKSIIQE